jgi:pyrimidine-nucleoside phosphorylase
VRALIAAYAAKAVPDYQMSAFLMAAFLNGLDEIETDALTAALLHSGRRLRLERSRTPECRQALHRRSRRQDLSDPRAAGRACGVLVPMVSGRGLGHTGGTLDKLESIPGFSTQLSPEALRAQLDAIGVVMVGQGPDLAPADGLLYALRDVTSTVESESFIVSSIVSKKVAEGAQAVVYDVKCGSGAFMKTRATALQLARRLVSTTRSLGREAAALVTDMTQPLGQAVGNALEVHESIDVLLGRGPDDVRRLTLELAAMMIERSGAERDLAAARGRPDETLRSGAAWLRFLAMVEAQGGDRARIERPDGLPLAPVRTPIHAPRSGFLAAIDTFAMGELVVAIGGGRRAKEHGIDPRVGLLARARIGDPLKAGDLLAELHLAAEDAGAAARAVACYTIADSTVTSPELILERVD